MLAGVGFIIASSFLHPKKQIAIANDMTIMIFFMLPPLCIDEKNVLKGQFMNQSVNMLCSKTRVSVCWANPALCEYFRP
jgi:hypothetical protein